MMNSQISLSQKANFGDHDFQNLEKIEECST